MFILDFIRNFVPWFFLKVENHGLFTISFKGLPLGSSVFDWVIDGDFFARYETSEINDASIDAQVTLIKHTRFLELDFALNGWAEVICDRCLDPLKLELDAKAKLIVKIGEGASENDSDDDDVIFLLSGEDRIDVAQYLYEYAHLNLPLRRVHPDDENGNSACNAEMISKLKQYLIDN